MRYRSLRRFPVPLVTTGSGKRLPDVEGSNTGSPLGVVPENVYQTLKVGLGVPFRGSCKRGRVREGEVGIL